MQEVRSNRVAVRPERRRQAEQEMKGFFEPALQALHGAWSHSGERVLETVLRALAQWLNLTSASGISCDTLRQNELVRKAFEGLADPQLFDSAVDCLDELIWCTVSLDDPLPRIRGEMMPLIQVPNSLVPVQCAFQTAGCFCIRCYSCSHGTSFRGCSKPSESLCQWGNSTFS